MDDSRDHIGLVEKARLGDKESLSRLAEIARVRLRGYVYRLTLEEDLTQDIVQESILEMFKVFGKLKRADRFWSWLHGIAFNKVRSHYGKQWRQKTVSISGMSRAIAAPNSPDGLAEMVADEWKQIVGKSMRELEPRYRAILAMRCYDQMPYSRIAEVMGCSELGAQALFYRAKKSLAKKLSRHGLSKGSLLAALILFGKMTAPSKAALANVSVTAATVKVGVTAGLVAIMTGKAAVVSLTTAGVLAVGTMVATSGPDKAAALWKGKPARSSEIAGEVKSADKAIEECWYYFPDGADGPVMMRLIKSDPKNKQPYYHWRQNDKANYYFDKTSNTIHINNYRMWRSDLGVWRLPTDTARLRDSLDRIEGYTPKMEYVCGNGDGLLVITKSSEEPAGTHVQTTYHYSLLDEQYFRYNLPKGVKVVDNRDLMHRRGWTYFRITGDIKGKAVVGAGRMPFVYEASERHPAWLRLQVAERKLIDAGDGWLFNGLSRPWMGLHTIDAVRRDAAQQQVSFETTYTQDNSKAKIILRPEQGKITYTVDMKRDVIEKITFSASDGSTGELSFSYLQDIADAGDEFIEPRIKTSYGAAQRKEPGMLWLVRLAEGELGM